jgi:alpha-L-fucosidase 2
MTDADLGDPAHRHLSPLAGLFPGDRITVEDSPAPLVAGATALLTARGMVSYGWGSAWRALCWARLKNADKAYQLVLAVLRPSVDHSNGSAINLFDMYQLGSSSSTFQIDANFGTPSAMVEMLLQSRPGRIELLPALPSAWAASGRVTGIGARGGFTVDLAWADGRVTAATVHGPAGARTTVVAGAWRRQITVPPSGRITVRPSPDGGPAQ